MNIKKLFLSIIIFASTSVFCFSQSYDLLEWDVLGFGLAVPAADGFNIGITMHTEPRVNIHDNLSIGLRGEWAFFANIDPEIYDDEGTVEGRAAYLLTPDYNVVNNKDLRVFVGPGIGFYSGKVVYSDIIEFEDDKRISSFGFSPRAGVELALLRIAFEYNIITNDALSDYFNFRLGLNIGGRHKG